MSQRLAQIPGIGLLTATALAATIGDIKVFKSARHLAAFLGLVPKQHSSGGKDKLLGISKRGDSYVRGLRPTRMWEVSQGYLEYPRLDSRRTRRAAPHPAPHQNRPGQWQCLG